MEPTIKLIVGLGNPGREYENTRHNAGANFVAALSYSLQAQLTDTPKFFASSSRASIAGNDVRLAIPSTFMNLSGKAIGAMSQFYKFKPEEILVVHDELDIPVGAARLKRGGGPGGHNGLRDTIKALGNNKNFARLRLGIGHPGDAKLVSNYVLKKAPSDEQTKIDDAIRYSLDCIDDIVAGNWEKAMHELHSKT